MNEFKNILIVRTDRLGDVVLTTPAIAALRCAYPKAKISILISPSTREIVEGNPNIDEILIDDRKGSHNGFLGFWRLVREIKNKKFDVAFVYHTKKRTNLICFISRIPQRIGYQNDKFGFLLTQKIPDTRPLGNKHEAQYCLDVLKAVGIENENKKPVIVVKKEFEAWADRFLYDHGLSREEKLVAIHPGASCISKRWIPERFGEVADQIISLHHCKVVLVGASENKPIVTNLLSRMKNKVIDATGQTSVGQMAAILKRCQLLISNDSGPVHVAVALGVPVISIFGRNQAGLSPMRWGPLGDKDIVLHKEVGCPVCLAHNCQINFKCLDEIKTSEVLEAVDSLSLLW